MNMRERIAKAIYESHGGAAWDDVPRLYLYDADAVLAEMAEPTKAMIDRGEWGSATRSMADSFRAMLAAAGEPE